MKKIVLCIFIILMICETVFAAGKTKKTEAKEEPEVVEGWYAYRFIIKDGYRSTQASQCTKSGRSPAESAEERDKYGYNYKIIEQVTRKNKPVVVDIQTIDVRDIGYDYTSGGRARSYSTETYIITDRFVRGEKYCNEIKDNDLSGALDKQKMDRYR